MKKKQSSIEWVVEKLENLIPQGNQIVIGVIFEQAKEMHKEEIVESYREGRSDQQSKETFYHRNSEQYYNETFGGNNE